MERSELIQGPEIRFLHVRHAPEDVESVWAEAGKADIVLLETAGPTQENRDWLSNIVQETANTRNPLRLVVNMNKIRAHLDNADPFMVGLVFRSIRDKKQLYLIDTAVNERGFMETNIGFAGFQHSSQMMRAGDIKTAYNSFVTATMLLEAGTVLRDRNTLRQIETFVNTRKDWSGKKVCVVQGAEHTKVYREFVKRNPNVNASRTFMMMNGDNSFGLNYEFRVRISTNTGASLPLLDSLLKRDFIRATVIQPGLAWMIEDLFVRAEVSEKVARKLTDVEVKTIFKNMQDIHDMGERLFPAVRPLIVGNSLTKLAKEITDKHQRTIAVSVRNLNRKR